MEDYIQKQEKQGKKILQLLIGTNMFLFLSALVLSIRDGIYSNLFALIIMIILCVFIYKGGHVAKWIYIVLNTLNIGALVSALLFGQVISKASTPLNVVTFCLLGVSVITSILLLVSSSVKDFMHKQRD